MVMESDRQRIRHERMQGRKETNERKKEEKKPSHVCARPVQPCSPAARASLPRGVCLAGWLAAALFLEELAATPAKLRSSWHLFEGVGVSW